MSIENKKLALLHLLSQCPEPIGLPGLLQKLGNSFVERSVRRWLGEMVKEGLVVKTGLKRGTKYQISKRNIRDGGKTISCFSNESLKVVEGIRRPLYERIHVPYNDDWLENYQPNITFYIPYSNRIELEKAGKRSTKEDPAGTYAHQIFSRLLIDLSYNSSRLEGNTYSLLDTERLILEGASAEGKLDEEKIMILNHKEAIRYMVDNASKLKVNQQTICTLHFLLSDGLVESRYAGKLREYGVRVGGSNYIPYEDKRQLQTILNRLIEKGAMIENAFEQSLFLLAHLSYLQCFADVNKRTARLSANIPLIRSNLVPLSFNDVIRDDYTSAMIAVYELQDIRPLLDLYLFSYMRTCSMYDSTVRAIGYDEVRVRYRQQRRALIRDIILDKLTGETMINFITHIISTSVREEDRQLFLEDVLEDINEINENRIAGLGITADELQEWKNRN